MMDQLLSGLVHSFNYCLFKKCKAWIRCNSCQVTFGPRKGASGRRPFLVDLQQECCFLHLEQRHKMGRNSCHRLAASDCPKTDQTSTSHLFLLSFSFLPLGTRNPIPPWGLARWHAFVLKDLRSRLPAVLYIPGSSPWEVTFGIGKPRCAVALNE
jgi:hypothetical protein